MKTTVYVPVISSDPCGYTTDCMRRSFKECINDVVADAKLAPDDELDPFDEDACRESLISDMKACACGNFIRVYLVDAEVPLPEPEDVARSLGYDYSLLTVAESNRIEAAALKAAEEAYVQAIKSALEQSNVNLK